MFRTAICILFLACLAAAQTVVNMPNSVSVSATATDALNKWLVTQTTSTATTVDTAYTAGGATLVLASGTGFGANDLILVDSEVLLITAKATKTMSVTGAQLGTSAATHAPGANVTLLKYKSFRQLFLAILNDKVAEIMERTGAAYDTYQTAITNAKGTMDTAKSTAVQ